MEFVVFKLLYYQYYLVLHLQFVKEKLSPSSLRFWSVTQIQSAYSVSDTHFVILRLKVPHILLFKSYQVATLLKNPFDNHADRWMLLKTCLQSWQSYQPPQIHCRRGNGYMQGGSYSCVQLLFVEGVIRVRLDPLKLPRDPLKVGVPWAPFKH